MATMNVAIDNLSNMNWLVMPSDDPTSWNMPSANSLSFDYDLDLGGNDLSQFLDLEPKTNSQAAGEYFHLSNRMPSPEQSSVCLRNQAKVPFKVPDTFMCRTRTVKI